MARIPRLKRCTEIEVLFFVPSAQSLSFSLFFRRFRIPDTYRKGYSYRGYYFGIIFSNCAKADVCVCAARSARNFKNEKKKGFAPMPDTR